MSINDFAPEQGGEKPSLQNGLDGLKDQAIQQAASQLESKIEGKVQEEIDKVNEIVNNPIAQQAMDMLGRDLIPKEIDPYTTPFGGRLNHPDDLAAYAKRKTFKDHLANPTDPIVYSTLYLDGKPFLDKSHFDVELNQKTNDHDEFIIHAREDTLDDFEDTILTNSRSVLGKTLTINFHQYGSIKQSFMGIITKITNNRENGYGKLQICGHAPTILMENGLDCQSYENRTLEQIIKDATTEYPKDQLKITVDQPNTKSPIPYTVQYKESDYQFIRRLAIRYGEYFYYNGESLIFGNKVTLPIVTLQENVDLISTKFELVVKPQSFNYISYDSVSAEQKQKDSESVQAQRKENHLQVGAINASKEVFKKKPDMYFAHTSYQQTETDLKEAVRKQRESREDVMKVFGKSRDPQLKQGSLAKLIDINDKPMETYRIIEIKHYHDGNVYYNEFVGIPDNFTPPYYDENAYPVAEEQPAIVMENKDPQGMIKVQFPWQKKKNLKTPLLRIITPYAGKGKGMHIIPEVGEEVIVGFEDGNAERPFVFGAMFNGKASAGLGGAGNFMKGLQTPSGSRMQINDKEGSLHLQDNGGVSMKFDGAGTSTTNANQNHHVNAGSQHATSVGKGASNLTMDSGGVIDLSGNSKVTIKVGGSSIVIDGSSITLNSQKIKITGSATIDISSPKNHIGGETKIDGGDCFIN